MNVVWEVEPGRVGVRHVTRLVDGVDCQVFEVELSTKYADILTYRDSGDVFTILLDATPESLGADLDATTPTKITLRFGPELDASKWRYLDGLAKYTATVVLFRPSYRNVGA